MRELTPSVRKEPQTTSKIKAPGNNAIQPRDVGAFFASMKAAFPMWNVEPTQKNIALWHTEIANYAMDDLRRAYTTIINGGGKSPPTLPEVKQLCRGHHSDAQNRSQVAIDSNLSRPTPVSEKKAADNMARLRRILAGVELNIDEHSVTGHLSPALKRRFRESVAGYPTFEGHAIDPDYISNLGWRESYQAEIDAWRKENPNG